jgi:hypothetical protein
MNQAETRQLFEIALDEAQRLDSYLLIGALKATAPESLDTIRETMDWIKVRTKEEDTTRALAKARVCGFTVCAPRGKELGQQEIGDALGSILEAGLPTAIYQLPQVTQNELSPELASELAMRFENFIMFKDTSGVDRVALSGKSLAGVVTLHGAEGDYARWLRSAGGPYHGFMLSTANCFARELQQIIADVHAKRLDVARQMSERLTFVVDEVFRLVAGLKAGNAFTNANKAIDHFFAHGPRAAEVQSPRLHAGIHLPDEVIRMTGEILSRHELMPTAGYLLG